MLERLGGFAHRFRWWLLGLLLLCTGAGFGYGGTVARYLEPIGMEVTRSEADRVDAILAERFGQHPADVVAVLHDETRTFEDAGYREIVRNLAVKLRDHPAVLQVTTPLTGAAPLVSKSGHRALVVVGLRGSDAEKEDAFPEIRALLHDAPVEVSVGGEVAVAVAAKRIAEDGLVRAELVALPIVALLLLWFFRTAVAASIPLIVGASTIGVAMGMLRLLSLVMDVSVFALNIVTFLGLGLAIDYSLFVVQRFREELHGGASVQDAVRITNATAGRTIGFSAIAVAVGLLGLLWFPITLLRSIGIGGALIVFVTLLVTVVVLPAALATVGRRIESLPVLPRKTAAFDVTSGAAYRISRLVMRHPIAIASSLAAVLLVAGAPFLRMESAAADARVFPPGSEVREVHETLTTAEGFDADKFSPYQIVVRPTDGDLLSDENVGRLWDYARRLRDLEGVERVGSIVTGGRGWSREQAAAMLTHLGRLPEVARDRIEAAVADDSTVVTVIGEAPSSSEAARRLLERIREAAPPGLTVMIGGATARTVEVNEAILRWLPWGIGTIVVVMFVVLFLAVGSIPVSIKAIVMNFLSLTASFGALVWIFQDGRFEGLLGYESPGAIDPTIPVVMFAIVFGLSMDYEVFLLSRIREAYDRSGDNRESVARGLSATGRIITSAALMLVVVMAAIATGGLLFLKQLGVGMSIAIALDATIVRGLLVPSTMVLMGRFNWWAPGPLARWWRRARIGVDESGESLRAEADAAGRSSAT